MDGREAKDSSMVVPVLLDYFRTMGGRMLYGREFNQAEIRDNARVAVVNEAFASEFGRPADAVGREIAVGRNPPFRIVGVVKGMDYMTDGANGNQMFIPSHAPGGRSSAFVAKVEGRAEDRVAMISDAIQSVDTEVPVFGAKTMEQRLDDARALGASAVVAIDDEAAIAKLGPLDAIADTVGGEIAAKLLAKVKPGGSFGYASVLPEGTAESHPDVKVVRVFAQPDPAKVREFADDVRDGKFVLPISHRLPLRDAAKAQEMAQKGGVAKIVLVVHEPQVS